MTKIMFNDKYGLTEAVLNGKKTQTRRVINMTDTDREYLDTAFDWDLRESVIIDRYANYKVGEVVAVAQKYSELEYGVGWVRRSINKEHVGWNNKMFVSADEMPHHIRITNIRVERLQDISNEDCMAEGIYEVKGGFDETNYAYKGIGNSMFGTARCAYMSLIDKVCGCYVWNQNPYVFVYEFVKED